MTRARELVAGSGEPLVLLHGLAGSWRWWRPVVEPLARRRQVHALDLPRVPPDELGGWLERRLEAEGPVDLAAHSLGGLVAADVAARRPELVRRLVLVAPAGIPCGRSVPGRSLPLARSLYDVRGTLPVVVADALRAGPLGLARGIAYVSSRDLRGELAAVQADTLLLWGARDRLVPLWVAEEWQRVLPHARLELLACGHVPMLEQPEAVAAHMLAFLEQQLVDDSPDEVGPREVNGVRLAGHDDQPPVR
jgi:pimeloyl-ACP methyl ester carboxylesterase